MPPDPRTQAGRDLLGRGAYRGVSGDRWGMDHPAQTVRDAIRAIEAEAIKPYREALASAVGRVIEDHYQARRAADPNGPPVHECGGYCGADISARLAEVSDAT